MQKTITRAIYDKARKDYVQVELQLSVDELGVLDALGAKAYRNKSKIAKDIGGTVSVKVTHTYIGDI
jgi:subtilisin-like proprotein convertase family protein